MGQLIRSPTQGSGLPPSSTISASITEVSAQVSTQRASSVLPQLPTRGHSLPSYSRPAFALGVPGTHKSCTQAPPVATTAATTLHAPCIDRPPPSLTVMPTASLLEGGNTFCASWALPQAWPKAVLICVPEAHRMCESSS